MGRLLAAARAHISTASRSDMMAMLGSLAAMQRQAVGTAMTNTRREAAAVAAAAAAAGGTDDSGDGSVAEATDLVHVALLESRPSEEWMRVSVWGTFAPGRAGRLVAPSSVCTSS